MRSVLHFLYLITLCLLSSCSATVEKPQKINGVSFVASRLAVDDEHVAPLIELNANYAAVMPFGFIRELAHPEINFNSERQWFGETEKGVKQYIETLQKNHIKIMMKPQIWVRKGEFTGFIKMAHEEDWKLLENSYTDFILTYARVAEDTHVDIFCIGTELENFIDARPAYWEELIVDIRKVYKGKLTYAANWDEYDRTPFWADLDYIGIDAYFPLSDKKTPTLAECKAAWAPYKKQLKAFSEEFHKPILFTEYGYRSVDYTAEAPWKSDREMTAVNMEAQSNAMQSLFEENWSEDWFAGGFVWKWFHDHNNVGGDKDTQFTPQNKPVEAIISTTYKQYQE
ncbi:glycoside hydrolase family 113 [Gelidibacter salicanalis]|uniref:Glycoside hydrolase TIM-barrel-like domain-containing protein n=1 Tax=Gelidibacter salicanalis TaxID=291193 RepID=A0A934KKL2_9FLAO|nr:glycoside hydrolase TIM-barrel-like domain-containing protein [Gelidibacter salicanalis]MBJ7880807.1 glycoside hydrolase TIM-barrel-like domain-containing protein [Gelidibacter salicanalis]